MRNVLLIGVNSKFTHSNLAIRYMRAYADVPIFECTINDDVFSVYRKLLERQEDCFCFSTYIWNIEFIKRLCGMLIAARPCLKIILGGPEAGYDCNNLFAHCPWLFGVITGEGEDAVMALRQGKDFSEIPNLSYREKSAVLQNPLQKTDLNLVKFPYTNADLDHLKNRIVYFETARGCLFRCAYCLSSAEGKTRFFSMDYVKQGLLFFMENEVPLVKLVDRTFNENAERACEIVSFILEHNRSTRFHFEVAPQLLTEEFVALCAKAPWAFQFEMGIQTTNPDTMKAIKRPYDLEKTAEKIKSVPKSIHQHLDLIAGLPYETLDSFKTGFNYVYALRPHMLQLGFLKLLKHTAMFDMAKDFRIQTTDFAPFEVLQTDTLSAQDIVLLKKTEDAVDRMYNSGAFTKTLEQLSPADAFAFYSELGCALYEKERHAPISRTDLYVFMAEQFPAAKKNIILDFLQNNHKAKLPEIWQDDCKDSKALHKTMAKTPEFENKKFRLVFAADCVFAVSDSEITEIDIRKYAEKQP